MTAPTVSLPQSPPALINHPMGLEGQAGRGANCVTHAWFTRPERPTERTVSPSPAPPAPTPVLARWPGKQGLGRDEAELGARGKAAEAAGPGSPGSAGLMLSWVG